MTRPSGGRRWSWLALIVVVGVALAIGMRSQEEPTRAERARDFAETVKCPRCRSQSVADSDAPIARELHREIERRFEEGQNEDQVRQYLLDSYGEDVLLVPPRSGFGSLVWVLPVAALLVAFAGLAVVFRRWKRFGPVGVRASGADRQLVAAARGGSVDLADDPHGEGEGR